LGAPGIHSKKNLERSGFWLWSFFKVRGKAIKIAALYEEADGFEPKWQNLIQEF
jgi:hypothetical protein